MNGCRECQKITSGDCGQHTTRVIRPVMTYGPRITSGSVAAARLAEIGAFAEEHGYNALTGSDAIWLLDEIDRQAAEIQRMAGVVEAARDILEILHWTPQLHPRIAALGVALATLDAEAPAASTDEAKA